MKKENVKFIAVSILLIIIAAISIRSYSLNMIDITDAFQVSRLPLEIQGWKGQDIEISEQTYKILETRNLLIREYKKDSVEEPVYLSVVYSEDNRKVSHPPEICLMGSGLEIVDKSVVRVPVAFNKDVKANRIITEAKDRDDMVIYWYKSGDLHTNNYLKQQLRVVLARTFGKRIAGAMIKVSTRIAEDGQQKALERIKSFSKELYPLLSEYIP